MKEKGFIYKVQRRIIDRTLKNNKRNVIFPNINSIQKVGIVAIEGSLNSVDLTSIQLLKNANLFSLKFLNKKRTKANVDNNIYKSDLNIWGLPRIRKINEFINEPFDLLINLSGDTNKALTYICAASKSNFKISINSNEKVYDLIIDQKDDKLLDLFTEIEKVLNNLNKNI